MNPRPIILSGLSPEMMELMNMDQLVDSIKMRRKAVVWHYEQIEWLVGEMNAIAHEISSRIPVTKVTLTDNPPSL